ncbi:hypothetical protein [Cryobacterium arcticum]|nr:hypothetical protein [Cryobacterium arcticum]
MVSAIIHISVTAIVYLEWNDNAVLADIRDQIRTVLAPIPTGA